MSRLLWWTLTFGAATGGLIAGAIVTSIAIFIIGTGDPRWNLPQWYGISVELLDYMTVAAAALFAGIAAGIFGTSRLSRSLLVAAGTVAALSVLWLLAIHPQHTNDITWQMSGELLLSVGVTVVGSAVIASWLLRREDTARGGLHLHDAT